MMYIVLPLALFINTVVWSQFYQMFNTSVDPAFVDYKHRFERHYGKPVSVGINFGEMENAVGVCYYVTGNIEIDKDYWDSVGESAREELIFHELGHCVLNKEHNEYMMGDCPASIMYPELTPGCYDKHKEYYIKELFDKFYPIGYNGK